MLSLSKATPALLLSLLLCCCALADESRSGAGWSYECVGNCSLADNGNTGQRGAVIGKGGSTDIEAAFRFLLDYAAGGRILVLRAAGGFAYNEFIYEMGCQSAATLIITERSAVADPFVAQVVRAAQGLWFAGGDQAKYYNFWKDTVIEEIINGELAGNIPIGGTSAGMAVLGQTLFAALGGGVVSKDALKRPAEADIRDSIRSDFLRLPLMKDVITDQHFEQRDRMGRMLVFMGTAWQQSGRAVRGISSDEQTAFLLDVESGIATTVTGAGDGADPCSHSVRYFSAEEAPDKIEEGKSFSWKRINVVRVEPGRHFNLRTWKPLDPIYGSYNLTVTKGKIEAEEKNEKCGIY